LQVHNRGQTTPLSVTSFFHKVGNCQARNEKALNNPRKSLETNVLQIVHKGIPEALV